MSSKCATSWRTVCRPASSPPLAASASCRASFARATVSTVSLRRWASRLARASRCAVLLRLESSAT
eukprot:8119859-Pyramimonas_sp.AAC.1